MNTEQFKKYVIRACERENPGLLPDEARWKAEAALEYYSILKDAEQEMIGDAMYRDAVAKGETV